MTPESQPEAVPERSTALDPSETAPQHPIVVRKMNFELPTAQDFDPKWAAGSAVPSYMATGVSLYVAYLEPFLVKSLRRVLGQLDDAALREDVDRFCRQEAQHYQQHERFNEAILAQGYPGLAERFERLKMDFEHFLAHKGDKWCVGFVEGFEAYTTQAALQTFRSRAFEHPKTDPRFGALFKWHLAEELEHRNVAFDVYEHLYGDWLFRARMCWVAQQHIFRFSFDCMKLMAAYDAGRFDASYRVPAWQRAVARLVTLPMRLRTMLPGYTPRNMAVPESLQKLSAELTAQAQSHA